MSHSGWVHLDVAEITRRTDKAFLLVLESGEEVWMPLSQILKPGEYSVGMRNCTVSVSDYIAKVKGLE